MVHAEPQSNPIPEVLPEGEVPGKSPTPEPELTTEAKESRALAEEGMAVTNEENSNEVAATEPTEENEERPHEATGEDEIAAAPEE